METVGVMATGGEVIQTAPQDAKPQNGEDSKEACQYCLSELDKGARICPKCRAYQGLLGRFSYWGAGLSLWIVCINSLAMLGIVTPAYQKYFAAQKAEPRVSVLHSDGTSIEYLISNSGNRPASPVAVSVSYDVPHGADRIHMARNLQTNFSNSVIDPGSTARFTSTGERNGLPPKVNPGIEAERPDIISRLNECQISVVYVDFDQSQKIVQQRYPCIVR